MPRVATTARIFEQSLTKQPFDLERDLTVCYKELIDSELASKKWKGVVGDDEGDENVSAETLIPLNIVEEETELFTGGWVY